MCKANVHYNCQSYEKTFIDSLALWTTIGKPELVLQLVCERGTFSSSPLKKISTRGEETAPPFFHLEEATPAYPGRENPRTLTHAREGQASRRAQRGVFFTPTAGNAFKTPRKTKCSSVCCIYTPCSCILFS